VLFARSSVRSRSFRRTWSNRFARTVHTVRPAQQPFRESHRRLLTGLRRIPSVSTRAVSRGVGDARKSHYLSLIPTGSASSAMKSTTLSACDCIASQLLIWINFWRPSRSLASRCQVSITFLETSLKKMLPLGNCSESTASPPVRYCTSWFRLYWIRQHVTDSKRVQSVSPRFRVLSH